MDRQQVSVRELARRLNHTDPEGARRTIARWLTSSVETAVNPSRASVRSVAEALGVDPASLASDDDDEESDLPLSRDELSLFFDLLAKVTRVEATA